MRRGELAGLRVDDIDWANEVAVVLGRAGNLWDAKTLYPRLIEHGVTRGGWSFGPVQDAGEAALRFA